LRGEAVCSKPSEKLYCLEEKTESG